MSVVSRQGVNGDLPSHSALVILDPNGNFLSSTPVLPDADGAAVSFIGAKRPGLPIYLSGSCLFGDEYGLFAHTLHPDWSLSEPTIRFYPNYTGSTSENALPTEDGGLLIGGTLRKPPFSFNKVALIKIGANGSIEQDTIHGQDQGQSICRQVVEWNGAYWITVDGRLTLPDPVPRLSAFRLNSDLGIDGWFQFAGLDVDPSPPFDSIPEGVLDLVPISRTRYATSGRGGEGMFPIVLISDSTREVFHHWLPRSTYTMDYPPFLQSLSQTQEGTLLYALHENYQYGTNPPYTPYEPDRIHVYKLDTSLNVLCEYIVDGFADNAYYTLHRIKASDDGGFILMGARRSFDDPSGYFEAWAQKFAATDCVTGMADSAHQREAVLFPNPSREGFTLMLSGEVVTGIVQVFDAAGRTTGSAPILGGQGYYDASGLPAGLYAYRVVDLRGEVRATGRWVKE